jgi:hypothetical protein
MSNKNEQAGNGWVRPKLAITVLISSAGGLIVVAVVVMGWATNKDEAARLIFAAFVPLFGTWVGTVLAYYFSAANLEAATRSTQAAVDASLKLSGLATAATPVIDKMIPWDRIKGHQLDDVDLDQVKLKDLWDNLTSLNESRLPVFGPDRAALAVVHKKNFDAYASDKGSLPDILVDPIELTVGDVPDLRDAFKAIAFVPRDATLGQARQKLGGTPAVENVFVTEKGSHDEPVLGWLTHSDLAELSD